MTNSGLALVSRDLSAFDSALTASTAELSQLRDDGRVFLVGSGTRVRVLDADARHYQVKILDGDYAGATGYVPAAFVQK